MTTKPGGPALGIGSDTGQALEPSLDMRFTSTPRGVRLARRLTAVRLDAWGIPYGSDAHDAIVLIVAELAANAVRHGCVPGRDFHLLVHAPADTDVVRVEVTDTRAERLPRRPSPSRAADAEEENGRGLILVSHLASAWGWRPRLSGPGKTVWADYVIA
ncbi:ATP-binding protein [Streptomyces chilikensis]|uniref:ATP-binding protein n=1 Tax=Streptomyces chilikensis TaxID=1194079 RepID=UPI000AF706C7|nr:ATP-binding protein [Streptomyces chilikensis]